MKKILISILGTSSLIVALSIAYYFIIFVPKKENGRLEIERLKVEQQRKDKEEKSKQDKRDYIAKRKAECYSIYEKERKQWDNVEGQFYDDVNDDCVIRYTTTEYKGVDCKKEYGNIPSLELECNLGIFTKRF